MNREVKNIFNTEAVRAGLLSGTKKVYEVMKGVYGPTSGDVIIEKNYGDPISTHDGVSVIREIFLKDPVENMAARRLAQASKQTNNNAGDGTTATVILASHIIEKSFKRISAGYNPMALRRGIMNASTDAVDAIKRCSTDVKDKLGEVATVACGDENLGKLISDAIENVGETGNVTVEESREIMGVEREIVEGFNFKNSYAHPYMVTNPDKMVVEFKNPFVLVTEKKLNDQMELIPLFKSIAGVGLDGQIKTPGRKLLIVGDVSGSALNFLLANKQSGAVISASVMPPIVGDQSSLALEDLAIYTGAHFITNADNLEDISVDDLGRAESVFIDGESITIIKGDGKTEEIKKRISGLHSAIKEEKNAFRKERMEDRLARISGKVGVIKVGGATESEMLETKDRVDDAVCATKAAKEEGVIPGGGVTMVHISSLTNRIIDDKDEREGYQIVVEALKEPFKQLMENSFGSGEYYLKSLEGKEFGFGYDVKGEDALIDLRKYGIIDATKVIRSVIENACSIASNIITTNSGIAFEEKKNDTNPA